MGTAVCGGPSVWLFSSKHRQEAHVQLHGPATRCCHHSELNSFRAATPWSLGTSTKQGSSWSASSERWRSKTWPARSVERLGLDGAVSEDEDSSAASLELVDTDGIVFEETDDITGMLRQPRSFPVEDWEMFAAEEGARPATDDGPVRRRKAEDALPFPATNWTTADKAKLKALLAFQHRYESEGGVYVVESMRPKHMHDTEELLVDSFAELMGGLLTYRPLLAFTVKQYVRERYATLPHSVTLVGLYSPPEGIPVSEGSSVVAGTVELSFSVAGHPDVPTPAPPPHSPYICNMAIKKEYRRRGLGRQMLKAAEELALSMGCEDMYLHVRIMDTAPLTMYREAGYQVVSTDSLLSVLTFQRRRHLMRKRLSRAKLVPE